MLIKSPIDKIRKDQCSLEISDAGIAYARILHPAGNAHLPILKECMFFPFPNSHNQDQLQASLASIARTYNPKGASCNWVLAPGNYHLLLTNIPSVSPEEYKIAVRWQIKDMIDYPIGDTTLDIFIPPSFSDVDLQKLYVVAAQSSFLRRTSASIKQASFELTTIDIREFAVRNLLSMLSTEGKSLGFLHFDKRECLFVITRNNQLCLTRNIPFDTTAEQSAILSKLANEIQRSLDYYSGELKQDILTEVFTPPAAELDGDFINTIKQKTSLTVSPLPLNRIVKTEREQTLTPEIQKMCYLAIGGALRKSEEKTWNKAT